MLTAHTSDQVRAAEQVLLDALPDGALMQRAATGLAVGVADALERLRGRVVGARVLLVVGAGNNGGDALFAGAWLARRGVDVRWTALSEQLHADALAALRAAGARRFDVADLGRWTPDLALDGLVGLGGKPGLRDDAVAVFAALSGHSVPVVAVDLPSGVDVDGGETPGPHVRAHLTFTFGSHKVATLVDPSAAACGEVRLVDIGLDVSLGAVGAPQVEALEASDVAALLPRPGRDDHKYTRGVVGVRAGSVRYPGAGLLCVAGAATGLAGMVRYAGDAAVEERVRNAHPEVVGGGRVQAWAVGSGGDDGAEQALLEALGDGVPVVADADAVRHVATHLGPDATHAQAEHSQAERSRAGRRHAHTVVLTPHAGELAELLAVPREAVEARPLAHARDAAERFGVTVLLKGPRTLVVSPDGRARVNTTGTPWLGTAGSGDVLTGLVGALLATGLQPLDAASVGAWLHGAAGEHLGGLLVAGDLPHALREVLRNLTGGVGDSKA